MIELALWDTAGQEDYDRLRPLSYPEADVILICFSIDLPNSFSNVMEKWVPEVLHYCHRVPFLLVGCKTDLRNGADALAKGIIREEEGRNMARRIGAYAYVECSAKAGKGVHQVFETAASASMMPATDASSISGCEVAHKKKHAKCIIH